MNIVVLVKQVPDSGTERALRPGDNTVDRQTETNIINEMDEYAIEEAVRVRDAHGGEITVLTVGPPQAAGSIRKALQFGLDRGVHVVDEAMPGSDALATSKVIAAALRTLNPDLVLCGAESTDGRMRVIPQMLAERLGIAALTGARRLTIEDASGGSAERCPAAFAVTVERHTEQGYEVVTAHTPAVVSVWDTINNPRYPSFRGFTAAKKKPVSTLGLADLGIAPAQVGWAAAASEVIAYARRPPRQRGTRIVDTGDAGIKLVDFLAAEKFV